ncbi:carbohydrate ABC transporter permease [Paenibacillus allorhizosphaerae]|uniref:L-arabinose transport system permease protein AraQ n=1 Tax=Paenibacillus allorhizosphaerae TaxID=2849866 RepID=A0ABN7TVX3_9BACL|nr:carbohydrate ABC transporter permease [Paenibacillus allorhizosphaerae]CAG7654301.1 L-arabinose transport system permease protein AraQ [Paenibacillus allorhizosphaerae]
MSSFSARVNPAGGTEAKSADRLAPTIGKGIVWLFLLVIVFSILYPVLFTLFGSLKTNSELLGSTSIIPEAWQWHNYIDAWKKANFAVYTWNSLFISVISTVMNLIVCSMGAYALARRNFPGRGAILFVLAATMFITIGAITYRPLYDMMKSVHMHKSLWSVILIFVGTHLSFYLFLLERFVKAIPKDLDEAATIDGCGFFGIYWRVILPLLGPGLGVVGLFTFRDAWNQYILPLIFTMTNPSLRPLTVGVISLKYSTNAAAEWHLMLAGSMLSMLPILVVYFMTNKSFIAGITSGSVKG